MNEADKIMEPNNNKSTPESLINCLSELPPVAGSPNPPPQLKNNNTIIQNGHISLNTKLINKKLNHDQRTSHPKSSSSSLNLNSHSKHHITKPINKKFQFQYGNYNRYYGYRMKSTDFKDIRMETFKKYPELFRNCSILDIGCNDGTLTISLAKTFQPKRIIGLDIDRHLIDTAKRSNEYHRKKSNLIERSNNNSISSSTVKPTTTTTTTLTVKKEEEEPVAELLKPSTENCKYFDFDIEFIQSNYVLESELLLEMDIEKNRFDTILCLSVIKWIHLNWGDFGVRQTFKRIYGQLKPGGHLILEFQHWKSYKKRRTLTENIRRNYDRIQMRPTAFIKYLLSDDVGFQSYFTMIDFNLNDTNNNNNNNNVDVNGSTSLDHNNNNNNNHDQKHGFNRPIYVFVKSSSNC